MIFVDTNVLMYTVGGDHPLGAEARRFMDESLAQGTPLVTSAEVLQELLHVYLRADRPTTLAHAFELVGHCMDDVWPVEGADVALAHDLSSVHAGLEARDLVHLACCRRRKASGLKTFDRALAAAWQSS
ncbi:MAG: type II toxin-antitoxin system VapC family toxin [Holophagales bacterium]|nr:type II toxin-antitoxin system VapC family toxin [Holophagales bacterium]MYF93988.1 type II toxin-antitoxin system VapC family toxin [Holophagales bacterium]